MGVRQKKYGYIAFFSFFLSCTSIANNAELVIDIQPLDSERFYAETPVSSVVRTLKQLCTTMRSIKNSTAECNDCAVATILEIQSLSVCGAFQELDRAVSKGLVVGDDQISVIKRLWVFLQELAQDQRVQSYLYTCQNAQITSIPT